MILSAVWAPSVVVAAIHQTDVRTFTSNDGRSIEAKVDGYNPHTKMASLRLVSGKKHDIPLDMFIPEDQQYLIQWRIDYDKSFVKVEFFTHRIDSGRIVFMLDRSGSMAGDRWDKMVRNMCAAIDRMNSNADFNIILFGSDSELFKEDLVLANEDNKSDAISWLRSRRPNGSTNLFSAVKAAASMKRAEVYAVLSDGYPTGDVDGIYNTIGQSRARNGVNIRVFTVSYQSSEEGMNFMKILASEFDGSHVRR